MALPDFLVIGAPKAGTTALHAALARHPGLYMSEIKEPKFFLTDGPPPLRGGPGDAKTYREHVWRTDDYEALFDPAPPGALRGESTPFYLYDRDAQRRIRRRLENQPGIERPEPMMTASNIHYEIAEKVRGIAPGGIGAVHLMARRVGLVRDIDEGLDELLKAAMCCQDATAAAGAEEIADRLSPGSADDICVLVVAVNRLCSLFLLC